jgi:hypothetical protein
MPPPTNNDCARGRTTPPQQQGAAEATARQAARNRELAKSLDLVDLSYDERRFLAACQSIHRGHTGNVASPFEDFFKFLGPGPRSDRPRRAEGV